MNSLDDSGAVFNYHRNMAILHGADNSLALGWLTRRDQQIRFEVLTGIAELKGKTVLDAGCGYADLLDFLLPDNTPAHYYGVEQIPELIDEAKNRCRHFKNVSFIERNFSTANLPVTDYVFASGSLNYRSTDPGYVLKAITKLFECCRLGLAFNLLKHVSHPGLLVAYQPEIILAHCRTLSTKVIFTDGYADEDFTIWMYR